MTEQDLLFTGLKVIDAGSWIAAPAAATVLADFGADVVKLEPLDGDPLRALAANPSFPDSEHDYFWMLDARSKRSLALDLKADAARPVLDALVRDADVFVTNYREDIGVNSEHPGLCQRCVDNVVGDGETRRYA